MQSVSEQDRRPKKNPQKQYFLMLSLLVFIETLKFTTFSKQFRQATHNTASSRTESLTPSTWQVVPYQPTYLSPDAGVPSLLPLPPCSL